VVDWGARVILFIMLGLSYVHGLVRMKHCISGGGGGGIVVMGANGAVDHPEVGHGGEHC